MGEVRQSKVAQRDFPSFQLNLYINLGQLGNKPKSRRQLKVATELGCDIVRKSKDAVDRSINPRWIVGVRHVVCVKDRYRFSTSKCSSCSDAKGGMNTLGAG